MSAAAPAAVEAVPDAVGGAGAGSAAAPAAVEAVPDAVGGAGAGGFMMETTH